MSPPILHLDTNHLIAIARCRRGSPDENPKRHAAYCALSELIDAGDARLVYMPSQAFEWVERNPMERIQAIARVFDDAPLKPILIDADRCVYKTEVLLELSRLFPDVEIPVPPIFFEPFDAMPSATLATIDPEFESLGTAGGMSRSPGWSVESELADLSHFVLSGHSEAATRSPNWRDSIAQNQPLEGGVNEWSSERAAAIMRDTLQLEPVVCNVLPGHDAHEALEAVHIANCPALRVYIRAVVPYIMATQRGAAIEENDVDDWSQLHVVGHAELSLFERKLSNRIRNADPTLRSCVSHDPADAVQHIMRLNRDATS